MVAEEAQEVLPLYEDDLRGIERFCSDLVRLAGERGTETENLARTCDPKHQALAVFRANGQFRAAIAEDENATRLPAFGKEGGTPGKQTDALDGVERLQGVDGEIAKDPVGPQLATKATRIGGALHVLDTAA